MIAGLGIRFSRRIYYGWWIVLTGAITMGMSSGLFFHGFGFYFEPMRQQFGWSRTLLSGAFSLTRIEEGFLGPVEGYLIQRFGPRNTMTVGFVIFGLGFILLSQVNSPLTLYLVVVVMALGFGFVRYTAVMATINNWFRRKRARAVSIAMIGGSLGGVVFAPALAFSIDNFDWRTTAFGGGIFVALVGIPLSRIIRYNPEPYGYLPDGDDPPSDSSGSDAVSRPASSSRSPQPVLEAEYDFTLREALRTQAFWVMSLGHALALLVVSTISLHTVPFLESDLGFSKTSAAQVVMVVIGVRALGQAVGGILGDRFAKQYIVALTVLGHSGALWLLATADTYTQVILSGVIQGLVWGIRGPNLTAMRGDFFGRKSFAMIVGFSQLIIMLGLVVGPLMSGYLADQYSYSLGFKVVAVATLPAFFLFVFVRSPQTARGDRFISG